MTITIELTSVKTDELFNAIRDAVRNRDQDTLDGLKDVVSMCKEVGSIDGTDAARWDAYLMVAKTQISWLNEKDEKAKEG